MSTFNIANPIKIVNPNANLDSRYGPWSSVTDANNNINQNVRRIGLTVGVSSVATGVVEYWYKNGIQNTDLIIKTVEGGTGGTALSSVINYLSTNNVQISALTITNNLLNNNIPSIQTTTNRFSINENHFVPPNETGMVTQFSSGPYGRQIFAITHTLINTAFFGLENQQFIIGGEGNTDILFKKGMTYTDTNILSSGSEIMRIKASNSSLGIGTNNPNEKLTVVGNISTNGIIYTPKQNSENWNSVYSNINSNSSNYITYNYVNNFLPLSGGNITGNLKILNNLTVQQKISSQENISNSLSSQTVKISNILFTGKTTTAASFSGENNFIEIIINNQKRYLQVFDIELPLLVYVVNFENSTKGLYQSGNVNLNGLLWNMTEALIGTLGGDYKEGTRSARLRGYGSSSMTMLESKPTGIGSVSFKYRAYSGDAIQIQWIVQYSMDSGQNWTTIGSFTATDIVQTFNQTVNQAGFGRIRIIANTALPDDNRRTNVDDIVITEFL